MRSASRSWHPAVRKIDVTSCFNCSCAIFTVLSKVTIPEQRLILVAEVVRLRTELSRVRLRNCLILVAEVVRLRTELSRVRLRTEFGYETEGLPVLAFPIAY